MAGGMFSGHDQCDGDVIEKNGKKFKLFYGMASSTAMLKHSGEFQRNHLMKLEFGYFNIYSC